MCKTNPVYRLKYYGTVTVIYIVFIQIILLRNLIFFSMLQYYTV